jgi:N-acetylglucosamine kinase-like BadF-type ATPase
MTFYLAVDGGNSKTDVVLGTADGEVLAWVRGSGTNHQTVGLDEALSRLRRLVDRARRSAGIGDAAIERAEVFLAGADLPAEVDLLERSVGGLGWAPLVRVYNDTFALLRAGTDAADAVAVVCGAGINCTGRAADGRTARFPSLGFISGDWGGGGFLATMALWHAVRAEDGRGAPTALSRAIADHFGLSTAEEVSAALHLGTVPHARLRGLAPVLFAVAAAGDPVADSVVRRQVEEIIALATVAARRLDLLDRPFTIVLGGGVLRAGHPSLNGPVTRGILAAAPKATVTVVDAPPVLGAALSALDALRASPEAHADARARLLGSPIDAEGQ